MRRPARAERLHAADGVLQRRAARGIALLGLRACACAVAGHALVSTSRQHPSFTSAPDHGQSPMTAPAASVASRSSASAPHDKSSSQQAGCCALRCSAVSPDGTILACCLPKHVRTRHHPERRLAGAIPSLQRRTARQEELDERRSACGACLGHVPGRCEGREELDERRSALLRGEVEGGRASA